MELEGTVGEITAVVHITRAATGKVETYELKAPVTQAQLDAIKTEQEEINGNA